MEQQYRFAIAGSGTYLPSRIVEASELDQLTGASAGSTRQRFGVERRHYAGPDETSSKMAAAAARAALAEADWDGAQLDVIIAACGVMEQPLPSTAVLVQRELGLGRSGIPAFDINASCLSFLQALDRVLAGFALGQWQRALIVCADIASAVLDYSHPEAAVLFGDGAAAIALQAGGPHSCLAQRFRTYGESADICRLDAGGTRLRPQDDLPGFLRSAKFHMDGPAVFRATSRRFPAFITELLHAANVTPQALSCILPHQASGTALEHLKRSLDGGHAKTVDLFAEVGNLIATSLPFTLHVARQRGLLNSGEQTLLVGSSAGISLGGAVIRW
ncbi:MAG: Acetoacetyl CoA synthase NphT7 [Stenotrophomonas maltophilia]|nr:MAG: Acetoacetyl CoA synthase NphT7 [Stenotrophomonas maltophilia]